MFLIDDKLYKKAILQNNSIADNPVSSVSNVTHPLQNNSIADNPVSSVSNVTHPFNVKTINDKASPSAIYSNSIYKSNDANSSHIPSDSSKFDQQIKPEFGKNIYKSNFAHNLQNQSEQMTNTNTNNTISLEEPMDETCACSSPLPKSEKQSQINELQKDSDLNHNTPSVPLFQDRSTNAKLITKADLQNVLEGLEAKQNDKEYDIDSVLDPKTQINELNKESDTKHNTQSSPVFEDKPVNAKRKHGADHGKLSEGLEHADPEMDELRKRLKRIHEDYDYPPPKRDVNKSSRLTAKRKILKVKNLVDPNNNDSFKTDNDGKTTIYFVCTFCHRKFTRKLLLQNHLSKFHPKKNLKKSKGSSDKSEESTTSFICTICSQKFLRINSLRRHIKNIHPEYFEEWSFKGKKRKNVSENTNKIKKIRVDGRQKRKLPDQKNGIRKQRRQELYCSMCDQYFKRLTALERHNASIHDSRIKGLKRKSDNDHITYKKRQKGTPKIAIQYENYF
jgi:hypothetical protein